MERFFLSIRNGDGFTQDTEGLELPDLDAARSQAFDGIRSLLSDEAQHGWLDLSGSIEITDGDGVMLMIVPYTDAVDLRCGEQRP